MRAPTRPQPRCKAHWLNSETQGPPIPIATQAPSGCQAGISQITNGYQMVLARAMLLKLQVQHLERLLELLNLPEVKLGLSLRRKCRNSRPLRDLVMSLEVDKALRSTMIPGATRTQTRLLAANSPPSRAFQLANVDWMMEYQCLTITGSRLSFI